MRVASLGGLVFVTTRPEAPLDAYTPICAAAVNDDPASEAARVSNFVTVQSLSTFAVASVVLKTLWELTRVVFGPWADGYVTVLALCLAYGAWQLALSVSGASAVRGVDAVSATVIAIVNAAILAASVIGITEALGAR